MKIGIFGSDYQADKQLVIKRLFGKLTSKDAEIYIDSDFYQFLVEDLKYHPPYKGLLNGDEFNLDVALSLGGDGTFLRTVARINRQGIPILGINTGRLGFLADISSADMDDAIDELFKNYFKIEERTLLCLSTENHIYKGYNFALNEVAILKQDTASMINIHARLNDEFLASYQADGLLVATPTGSTAYSLSVNGPIMVPQSNNLIINPVAPHSLNVRPLVIPDTYRITLDIESRNDYFLVSLDGRSEVFPVGNRLTITKADCTTRVIKRYNQTFYKTLREKLMWGADVRM